MSTTRDVGSLLTLYRAIYAAGVSVAALAAVAAAGWALGGGPGLVAWPVAAVLAAALLYGVGKRAAEFRSLRHVPGPKPAFFLGNMADLLAHGHGGRDRALEALHERHGPVVRLHLAWGSAPLVSLSYASGNLGRKGLDSHRRADGTVLSRSLMGVPGGELHRSHRQTITPHLTKRSVGERTYVLREMAALYVEKWKHIDGVHDGLQSDLRDWSVGCLSAFLFGDDWHAQDVDMKWYYGELAAIEEEVSFRAFHPFFVRWIFPSRRARVNAAYRNVAGVMESVMRHRERSVPDSCPAHERPQDLLDQLVRPAPGSEAASWTEKDRVEELMSLILGGADPMSYVISQALVLLAKHPEVQQKAQEAAGRPAAVAVGTGGACPVTGTRNEAPDPYILDVVYETLRLYPPVPYSAKFSPDRPVEERGLSIPPGTVIMWMKNVVGRNKETFEDPDGFRPDRFSAQGVDRDTLNSFLPFGAGPRHCVGNRLAERQCAVLLTEILRNFDIAHDDNVKVEFHSTISVVPSTVPVSLIAR
ncbi:cytochrome P450 [Streptomyces sp. NA04227]|uniref:cytochrome P450 n=1 Tax=Streptomyces sp. NA04227 TaxID=2742136 RepID=UPI0015909F17|nr:cytochrome P450 [Streptomyces sp. NA04227]QKW10536.1 cytochrome P450 [Streptomyces sp. NA04227]